MLITENKTEERIKYLQNIMVLSYRKMYYLNEILRLTKEIGKALDRDDRVSVQMLLVSRQEEIENLDICRGELHRKVEELPEKERSELESILKGQADNIKAEIKTDDKGPESVTPLEKIDTYSKSSERILNEIVSADRMMSRRLAGKDSYYSDKK